MFLQHGTDLASPYPSRVLMNKAFLQGKNSRAAFIKDQQYEVQSKSTASISAVM